MLGNKQQKEHLICMLISTFYDLIFMLNLTKCEKGKIVICKFIPAMSLTIVVMFLYFSHRLIASMMPQVPKQTSPVVSFALQYFPMQSPQF